MNNQKNNQSLKMNRNRKQWILLTLAVTAAGISSGIAQPQDTVLRQEVEVTKAYRPIISDAFKINDIPELKEEEHQKPSFDYQIFSQPVFRTFSVNELQAATLTGRTKEKSGIGMIHLGAGNYGKPFADFYINNAKARNTLLGLHGRHLSSRGKIPLPGGNEVKAPFSDNHAEMFLKHYARKTMLDLDVSYQRDGFVYYGYPENSVPEQLLEDDQKINYFGTSQAFAKGEVAFRLQNKPGSTYQPLLGMDLKYHYFATKTGQNEHFAELTARVRKPTRKVTAMLEAGTIFYSADSILKRSSFDAGKRQEIWIKANPAVKVGNDRINLKAGGKIYFVLDNDWDPVIKIAPDVLLNITPIERILALFAGVDGKYQQNNYSQIAYENPFVHPMHDVKNSMHTYRLFGGVKGKFSSKINYTIHAGYSAIKDQPFYHQIAYLVPDANAMVDPFVVSNDFSILYDDLEQFNLHVEIYYTASEKFNLLLTGDYYSYALETESEAWNKPAFDAKLSLGYQWNERLRIEGDFFVIGERKGLINYYLAYKKPDKEFQEKLAVFTPSPKVLTMKTVVDLNLKGTYSITRDFSVFAQLNNFGFQNYERWLGYPVQRFNFLAGIGYAF
jgi:hypothetical protein